MRNRLVQVYDLADEEIAWQALIEWLRPLIDAIDDILGPAD